MSYFAEEQYDVYNETERRARKVHRCDACGETIAVGHVYARIFTAHIGSATAYVRCLRCQRIHEHLRTLGDSFDQLWPDEQLNCGEEYRQHWGEDPPPEIAALAFATAEEMQVPR